jgi:MATE family multidrug resistance protein
VSGTLNYAPSLAARQRGPTLQLLALALPIIAMMVSRMMMGFIDFWMVKYLGTAAQAAISPATMLVFTTACLALGIANSIQTFVSQADGRNEPEVCGSYAWQTLYLAAVSGLVVCPAALTTPVWYGWIAEVASHNAEMAKLEIAYTRIALWSVPFAVLSMGLNAFFMGVQRPRVALFAVILSLIVNATGNYVLIFGKFGFPEMGIAGAALATVIGWAVRAAFLAAAILMPEFDRRFNTRRSLAWSWPKVRGMLRIGGPTAVQWLVDIGSWLVFLSVIMPPYGVKAVAASNVGLQYMHLSFMPAIGIGIALCSQVGFAIGEGRPERAIRQAGVAMRLTGIFMGGVGLLFVLGGYPLMWLFNKDPAVIRLGQWVLVGAAIFQIFDAMSITYMNALRGAGDTRWPAVVVFACCWVIFVGGGVLVRRLLPELGLIGPWAMCATYIIVLGLMLRWRWRGGKWRQIRLFKEEADQSVEPTAELPAMARTASEKYAE